MSENLNLVRSLYAAYEDGDGASFFGALDANVEWIVSAGHPHGGTYVGVDSIVKDVQSHARNDWDGFGARTSFITTTDDHDVIMSTGFYSGTHKQTGKHLESRFCHVWRIKAGKVVSFESISDTSKYRDAAT